MRRHPRSILWTAALAALIAPAAAAQQQQQQQPDPASPDFDPARWGLAAEPLVNERLGISMYYPEGSMHMPTAAEGSGYMLHVQDAAEGFSWQVRFQQMEARGLAETNAESVINQLLAHFRRSSEEESVLSNQASSFGGRPGHELWMQQGDTIAGYLVAETGGLRFIVAHVFCTAGDYKRVRGILDPAFATLRIATREELAATLQQEVALAREFIATLDESRLRSLTGTEQWYRIYERGGGDWRSDTEVGYFRLEIEEGPRGGVEPARNPASYRGVELDKGLLMKVDARYLEMAAQDGAPPTLADFQVRMWQSWDRETELFLTRVTMRQGEAEVTESESGIRERQGVGFGKLIVTRAVKDRNQRDVRDFVVKEPYLTLGEVYMLGSLLPRDGSITGTMRFHAYDAANRTASELPVRVDKWNPASDATGHWVLESHPSPDLPGVKSIFDRDGDLLRREKSGEIVTEPVSRDQLLQIWRAKGLPV